MERNIDIKNTEKVVDEKTGVTGLEIEFFDEKGNKRSAAFDDYEDACKDCEDCGKPRYVCSLEHDAEVKPPSERDDGSKSTAQNDEGKTRTDVRQKLDI